MKLSRKLLLTITAAAFLFASCENGLADLLNNNLEGFGKPESFDPNNKRETDISNLQITNVNGTLSIYPKSGSASIPDFSTYNATPWHDEIYNSVEIGTGITAVGNCAFGDKENGNSGAISSVRIADTVTRIGDYAFKGSISLSEVTLPANLQEIGEAAFNETGINKLEIPQTVSMIGKDAFYGSPYIKTVTFYDKPTGGSLQISEGAFCGCNSLEKLSVVKTDGSITEEGKSELPKGLSFLGDEAFSGTNVNNVDLPYSVLDNIGTNSFNSNISVTIPELDNSSQYEQMLRNKGFNVETRETADKGGTVNGSIKWYFDSENKALTISGSGAIPDYEMQEDRRAPWWNIKARKIIVSDGITSIGQNAFNWNREFAGDSELNYVTIASSVKDIYSSAFANNIYLESVTLASGIELIGSSAFYYTNINSINIPASVTTILFDAFDNGTILNVAWKKSDSGHTIANSDNYSINYYSEEVVPSEKQNDAVFESVVSNGIRHWESNIQIKNYAVNKVDYTSGQYLEITCSGTPDKYVNEVNFDMYRNAEEGDWYGTRLNGGSTFLGLFNLQKDKPFTWTVLVKCAVDGSTDASGIVMNYGVGTAKGWEDEYGYSTNKCDEQLTIKDFTISVKTYYDPLHYVISYDKDLERNTLYISCDSVALPYFNIRKFGEEPNAVEGSDAPWTGRENEYDAIVFDDSIEYMSDVFYLCGNDGAVVDYIHLPDNLRALGFSSFWSTRSIRPVVIPSSIEYIGWHAFMKWTDCAQYLSLPENDNNYRILTGLEYENRGVWINSQPSDYYSISGNTLIVNNFSYLTESNWYSVKDALSNMITSVVIKNTVTTIPRSAFEGWTYLSSVDLSSSVSVIDSCAFYGTAVNSIEIPSTVYTVGDYAFNDDATVKLDWAPNDSNRSIGLNEWTPVFLQNPIVDNKAGDNITWSIYQHVISFSGSGDMYDYGYYDKYAPWYEEEISAVYFDEGITSIGAHAFLNSSATSVTIPASVETIAAGAFASSGIKNISFEQGSVLKTIGNNAFGNCEEIALLSLPSELTYIGDDAFAQSSLLTSVSIPGTVTYIGSGAFDSDCKLYIDWKESEVIEKKLQFGSGLNLVYKPADINDLYNFNAGTLKLLGDVDQNFFDDKSFTKDDVTEIVIGGGINTIYESTFSGCNNLLYVTPFYSEILSLEEIGENAFCGCTSIKNVILPNTVTKIGAGAFQSCTELELLSLSQSLETIDKLAFKSCPYLTQINLPDGLKTVKEEAFASTGIFTVAIPSSVTNIENNAFNSETELLVDWESTDTGHVIAGDYTVRYKTPANAYEYSATDELGYCVEFNSELEKIPLITYDIDASIINTVIINDGITSIGKNAFKDFASLLSIDIPSSVTSISDNAFAGGTILNVDWRESESDYHYIADAEKYTVNYKQYEYDETDQSLRIFGAGTIDRSFLNSCLIALGLQTEENSDENTIIKKVIIEEGVTTIENAAFQKYYALTEVTKNGDVDLETIMANAFYGCSSLTTVALPDSLETISEAAFGATAIESITIPASVTSILDEAFPANTELKVQWGRTDTDHQIVTSAEHNYSIKYMLSDPYEYVENEATLYISNVESVDSDSVAAALASINKSNDSFSLVIEEGVKTIGSSAFSGCRYMTLVSLPSTLTIICDNAFNACSKFNISSLPSGITTIGVSAFYKTGITQIDLASASLTSIGNNAFQRCSSLTKVENIPASLNEGTVGTGIFSSCTKLETVTFEEGFKKIGYSMFNGCTSLDTGLSIPSSLTSIDTSAFNGCTGLTSVSLLNTQVESINASAFSGCTNLSSVTLPNSLKSIGDSAFSTCKNISSISIPPSVKEIGQQAFSSCEKLETVDFNQTTSLTTINSGAFRETGLRSITIPGSVTSFGQAALSTCKSLETVEFENGDEPINFNGSTFYGCEKLSSVTLPDNISTLSTLAFQKCSAPTLEIYFPSSLNTSNTSVVAANTFSNCTSEVLIKANWNSKDTEITSSQLAANCAVMCLDSDVLVLYYLNNGSTAPVKKYYASTNDSESLLSPSEVTGKTFLGWYKEPAFNTRVTAVSELFDAVTGDTVQSVNLYALWAETYTMPESQSGTATGGDGTEPEYTDMTFTETSRLKVFILSNVKAGSRYSFNFKTYTTTPLQVPYYYEHLIIDDFNGVYAASLQVQSINTLETSTVTGTAQEGMSWLLFVGAPEAEYFGENTKIGLLVEMIK